MIVTFVGGILDGFTSHMPGFDPPKLWPFSAGPPGVEGSRASWYVLAERGEATATYRAN